MWLLLSSIPLVLCAEFVSPGLKVDAMASDERKGNRMSIRRKIVCFCEGRNLRWPAEESYRGKPMEVSENQAGVGVGFLCRLHFIC